MGSLLSLPSALPGVSKATQTEWNCPVCHSVQCDTVAVPCGHEFCLGCLLRHTASSPTCPLCNSPLLSARFSVLGRNDFLQCILSPPGAAPGPGSSARRALFRLVYTQPGLPALQAAPAESPCPSPEAADGFPADLWAELLHGHEHLLDPVRPWLRQSLEAIYSTQWWEARQVESLALSTLCICGPDQDGLTHMLQSYLGEYTAPLIHGLIHVTKHRCRDAWLQHRSHAARHEEDQEEDESPAASPGPSAWPGGTYAPGLAPDFARSGPGDQPGEPEPTRPGTQEQTQPQAWPEQDTPPPGPSTLCRRRNRQSRVTRQSRRTKSRGLRRHLKVRRKPRRK